MRTRLHLAAGIALLVTLAAPLAHAQNPNGGTTKGARGGGVGGGPGGGGPGNPGGPGTGGPGPGPGGGPGGFGGFGGRGNGPANESAERLLQIEAVQDDLKLDDKTKAKLKTLGEEAVKERPKRRDAVTKFAQQQAAEMQAAENAAMAERLAANGIEVDPRTLNNNNNNNGGGRGNRGGGGGGGGNNQAERTMINLAMTDFANKVDAAMLKLLDAKQKARLKQIQLQQEGSRAFTTPNQEVAEKLDMSEEQITEIRNANNDLRQSQRQSMFDLAASFAPADDTANNNNNNNGGGRGGRGGFPNLANLDEATRAKFDLANQDLQAKNSATSMAAIGKLLSAAQKKTYNKMIGEPFDLTKLRNTPPAPGATAATAAAPATKTAAAPAAEAATAKPARKSLRDSRGGN